MAIVATSLGSLGDTGAATNYGVALGRSPAANTLVLVVVDVTDTGAVEPTGVASDSLVFSLVTSSQTWNASARNNSVWRSMSPTPDGSRITATFPNNATGCCLLVTEFSGVSTSGTSGEKAVNQSANTNDSAANSLSMVIFAPSAASTANAWFATISRSVTGSGISVLRTFESLDSAAYSTPSNRAVSVWTTLASAASSEWSFADTGVQAGTMVEIVADNPAIVGGAVFSPYYASYYYPQVVAQC